MLVPAREMTFPHPMIVSPSPGTIVEVVALHSRTLELTCLGATLLLSACRDEGRPLIDFEVEQALYADEEVEPDATELAPGAVVGLRTRANVDYRVRAPGEVVGDEVIGDDGRGRIRISGTFEIVPAVELDLSGATVSGSVDPFEFDFKTDEGEFDPFVVGETITMDLAMPDDDEQRDPIDDVPGIAVELVIDGAPGVFHVTYQGVCLEREGDAIQYTGLITIVPDIRYAVSIQIAIPFVGTETIGPVEIPVPLPSLVAEPIDFGTFSVKTRRSLEGVAPCAGMELPPAEDTGDTGSGSDGGSSG
jgi:hypothetical protein